MVIHSLLPPLLGKGRGGTSEKFSSLFWERGGSHGHTEPASEKLSSAFWEREGVVVMVKHCGHGHTLPSSQKLSSFSGKGKWW